ncbi:response regulator transcription factor [Azospirillum oleiclasticum]|nr:response regulator transcription factor [Azospirillum oleiclasticum]
MRSMRAVKRGATNRTLAKVRGKDRWNPQEPVVMIAPNSGREPFPEHPIVSKTVIVVDDSRLSRMHVRGMILRSQPDWTVIEAGNSDELFARLAESDIQIAIIDFNMPGANGIEAATRLRAERPEIDLAIITANGQDSVVAGIRALGAAFMPKPLDEQQVMRFLASTNLPKRRRTAP